MLVTGPFWPINVLVMEKTTNSNIGLKIVAGALFLGLAGVVGYVALTISRQYQLLKKIKIKFVGLKVTTFKIDDVGLDVNLLATNISDLKITLKTINVDIYINGVYVNKVFQQTKQTISGNSTSPLKFNIFFSPVDVFKGLKAEDILKAFDYKSLVLKVSGFVTGSIDGITFEHIPINLESTLSELISGETTNKP